MSQQNDLGRSLIPFDQHNALIAVIEMSQSNWLAAGIVPGVECHPLKKPEPDEKALLLLLQRWRKEAVKVAIRLHAFRSPLRQVATGSGWRDGFGRATLTLMSSIRRALPIA